MGQNNPRGLIQSKITPITRDRLRLVKAIQGGRTTFLIMEEALAEYIKARPELSSKIDTSPT